MTTGEWLTRSVHKSYCQLLIGITVSVTSPSLTRTDLVSASRLCCRGSTVFSRRQKPVSLNCDSLFHSYRCSSKIITRKSSLLVLSSRHPLNLPACCAPPLALPPGGRNLWQCGRAIDPRELEDSFPEPTVAALDDAVRQLAANERLRGERYEFRQCHRSLSKSTGSSMP